MNLPTAEEINIHGSPDEASACEHFLGKTLLQAEKLFRDNASYYQEDLMWMGPKAFNFYLQALIKYLESADADGDDHIIDCMYEIVSFRMDHEGFPLAVDRVKSMISYILGNFEKFDVDEKIYGNLEAKYRKLQVEIEGMAS